jgi:hypothetical protein
MRILAALQDNARLAGEADCVDEQFVAFRSAITGRALNPSADPLPFFELLRAVDQTKGYRQKRISLPLCAKTGPSAIGAFDPMQTFFSITAMII